MKLGGNELDSSVRENKRASRNENTSNKEVFASTIYGTYR